MDNDLRIEAEQRLDDVLEPELPELAFLVLLDAREQQPAERLGEDGAMDRPSLAILGSPDGKGLWVEFLHGVKSDEEAEAKRDPQLATQMAVSREALRASLPALVHYANAGKWAEPGKMDDHVTVTLDPFEREALIEHLAQQLDYLRRFSKNDAKIAVFEQLSERLCGAR